MENWNLHPEYESEAQIHELEIETIVDHNGIVKRRTSTQLIS